MSIVRREKRFSKGFTRRGKEPTATDNRYDAVLHVGFLSLRGLFGAAMVAAVACLMFLSYQQLLRWFDSFPIKNINITGDLSYADPSQLQSLIREHAIQANYFEISLDALVEGLEAMAWIEEASVEKVWPDQLSIRLVELEPIAVWQDQYLLSTKGDLVFDPSARLLPSMPRLVGHRDQVSWIMENYQEMQALLAREAITLDSLELTDYNHWRLGISYDRLQAEVWVDQEEVFRKLVRFSRMMRDIQQLNTRVAERFDLRYPKGIAVTWSDKEETDPNARS